MDKGVGYDCLNKKRSDYRSVKGVSSTVIDGDYVQSWFVLSKNRQIEVCKKMMMSAAS